MALETVKYLGGTQKEIAQAINDNFTELEINKLGVNDKAVSATLADSAGKLSTQKTITLTGAITGSVSTDLSGSVEIPTNISNIDANKITSGTIDIARLPAAALERMVMVADDTARFALTIATAQKGDTIKVTSTGKMYFVVDDTKLNTEAGYEVYTAGTASSVPWGGVTGKPTKLSEFTNDLNISASTKITFTSADARWGAISGGLYPLTLATTNKDILVVLRNNAGVYEECVVSVKVSGNNRIIESYDKFDGYAICI